MNIELVKISSLIPYKLNSKKHPQSQIEGIAESIKRFGFTQPVVIAGNNEIIIGHGRVEAASLAGLKEIPCVKRDDLTESEIRALRLIDNRISETDWDGELLNVDLESLKFDFDIFNINFDNLKIDKFQGFTDENEDLSIQENCMQFIIVVQCINESDQKILYEELESRGLKCKLIM